MRKLCQRGFVILISTVFVYAAAFSAFAATEPKDYRIYEAWWEENQDGSIFARWEKPESATTYKVHLYRGEEKKEVGAWISASGTSCSMTKRIYDRGQGVYYFAVYSVKGGEETLRWSDPLEVDYEMYRAIRAIVVAAERKATEEQKSTHVKVDKLLSSLGPGTQVENTTGTDRWIQLPDRRWVLQKPDSSLYKNTWAQMGGRWYLFDAEGVMQSGGWRCVNQKWYYLDAQGGLLTNTTTPDGYTVNANGEWVQNGQVVMQQNVTATKAADITPAAATKAVSSVSVSARESVRTVGMPKYLEVSASGAAVENVSYSKPYEQWKAGESITVTLTLLPKSGTYFASSTRYVVHSSFTQITNHGDSSRRTLVLSYRPKIDLITPTGFFMTSDNVLHWTKVEGATKYILRITPAGERSVTVETTKPEYDMSEYIFMEAKVSITASGPANSTTVRTSGAYTIEDLEAFAEQYEVPGYLTIRNGKPYYEDEFGEKGGWKELAGYWYHFKKNGYADGPGWFEDTDGNWYYFDQNYRMMTGVITAGGKQYAMNDGSDRSFPYGAWIH